MPTTTCITLLALAASLPPVQDPPQQVQHMVDVEVNAREMGRLRRLDLDLARVDLVGGRAEVVVTPAELQLLKDTGLPYRIRIENISEYYAQRLAEDTNAPGGPYGTWLSPPFGQGGMGGYYTLAELNSVLDQMRAAYPNLITAKQSIGTSIQGRSLNMVKISDNPGSDEAEPEMRVDALHHAREPQGMQCTLWFMLFLLEEYGNDPLADFLVNEREIYFIPCVNPDGYEYNRQTNPGGGGMWRKNRRNNGGGVYGVDLNRNYPYKWGYDSSGSSNNPSSETYRGTGPASEPSVAAMVNFIDARQFTTALSMHTYSNLWLAPWGYDTLYPANWSEFLEIGTLATEINGYTHGPASIILYEANGVTFDYDYGMFGTYAWTPEIGSSNDGFWPPTSRIIPLANENLLAMQRTALAAGAWVRLESQSIVDAGNGNGSFEAGEGVEFTVGGRNSGAGTASSVDLLLTSTSSFVSLTTPTASIGSLAGFTSGQNATPLRLDIASGTPSGTTIPYTITLTHDGFSQSFTSELLVGTETTLAAFDFEAGSDEGWGLGSPNNASTGIWTRVDPRGTAAQTEDDHTSGANNLKCWVTGQGSAGGSVGENDVDGGSTTLLSPVFDLSNTVAARVRYWRWYSNNQGSAPGADTFAVDVSNDGGSSWVSAELLGPTGADTVGGWLAAELDLESLLPVTSQMRIRFVASDLGSGSIVEAAVDDVIVSYIDPNACTDPINFCVGAPNSAGPGAVMSWMGSTDVLQNSMTLLCTGVVPNQFGLFFYADAQQQKPLGNGFLCLGGNLHRLPALQTDPLGQATYGLDFTNLPSAGPIANGETWNFQFWYREKSSAGGGYNFSDGLQVLFCQ